MSATEYERTQLFVWLTEAMGKERASTMMGLLPPVGWGDVATKRDLEQLGVMTKRDMDEHRAMTKRDLEELRVEMVHGFTQAAEHTDRGLAELRTEMVHGFTQAAEHTDRGLAELRTEMDKTQSVLERTLVTWILTSQATVIAAVGVLVLVVR